MQLAEFPIGTVVQLQSGSGKMTVVGAADSDGLLKCAFDESGVQYARLPPAALVESGDVIELETIQRRHAKAVASVQHVSNACTAAVEVLAESFSLRPGLGIVAAAEDAAAEYRAYREQDERLEQSETLQRWRDAAASYPDAAARLAEGLRANGQDDDLRGRAADLLEAFAR